MATAAAQIIMGVFLILLRKDLIFDALLTGLCLVIVSTPVYLFMEYLSPNFFEKTWLWPNLTGIRFIGIPIEDLVFYFLTGFCVAPFYLYWKNEKLRRISK